MNRYTQDILYDSAGGLADNPTANFSDHRLRLHSANLHPPLRVHHRGNRVVAMAGNPIVDGRRDDRAVLTALERAANDRDFFATLNGSFLIILYDPASGALTIGNDRFASLALYYAHAQKQLSASLSAKALYDMRLGQGEGRIDPESVFEFLYFRRLLGEKSFDPGVHYLRSASILRFGQGADAPQVELYWQPNYGGPRPANGNLADELAERLRQAVALRTADPARCALLLSGGLDSRAILAAMTVPPLCVTTALAPNNEVAVAREVAAAAGAEHRFVDRPKDIYDAVLDDAVFLSGGMQVYSEAQFLGYGPDFTELADCFLIGLGLDIFFGGLYLPKDAANVLGRPALHHRLRPLSRDLAADFIGGVKYRLRTSVPFAVVKPAANAKLKDRLRQSVEDILARGRDLGAEDYDLWEYMHLHNLSRHYSFPMMASLRTFADCRAPALENDLFDLAIRMTAQQKLDGTAYQRAIAKLNPAVMAVRNANTNVRADYSLRRQTLVKAARMAGHRLFGTGYPVSPGWRDRSWPAAKASLEASPHIHALVKALPDSERLADLAFLDMDAIRRIVEDHEAGRHDHAVLLNLLLTVDRVLAPSGQRGRRFDSGRAGSEPSSGLAGRRAS